MIIPKRFINSVDTSNGESISDYYEIIHDLCM